VLQIFLQTHVRVFELVHLRLTDMDYADHTLKVRGILAVPSAALQTIWVISIRRRHHAPRRSLPQIVPPARRAPARARNAQAAK